jgi:hypothetical protein
MSKHLTNLQAADLSDGGNLSPSGKKRRKSIPKIGDGDVDNQVSRIPVKSRVIDSATIIELSPQSRA